MRHRIQATGHPLLVWDGASRGAWNVADDWRIPGSGVSKLPPQANDDVLINTRSTLIGTGKMADLYVRNLVKLAGHFTIGQMLQLSASGTFSAGLLDLFSTGRATSLSAAGLAMSGNAVGISADAHSSIEIGGIGHATAGALTVDPGAAVHDGAVSTYFTINLLNAGTFEVTRGGQVFVGAGTNTGTIHFTDGGSLGFEAANSSSALFTNAGLIQLDDPGSGASLDVGIDRTFVNTGRVVVTTGDDISFSGDLANTGLMAFGNRSQATYGPDVNFNTSFFNSGTISVAGGELNISTFGTTLEGTGAGVIELDEGTRANFGSGVGDLVNLDDTIRISGNDVTMAIDDGDQLGTVSGFNPTDTLTVGVMNGGYPIQFLSSGSAGGTLFLGSNAQTLVLAGNYTRDTFVVAPVGVVVDVTTGTSGADTLTARGQNETLAGLGGADTLIGNVSGLTNFADTGAGLDGDTIVNFVGTDRIFITDFKDATTTLSYTAGTLTVTDGARPAHISLSGSFTATLFHHTADSAGHVIISYG